MLVVYKKVGVFATLILNVGMSFMLGTLGANTSFGSYVLIAGLLALCSHIRNITEWRISNKKCFINSFTVGYYDNLLVIAFTIYNFKVNGKIFYKAGGSLMFSIIRCFQAEWLKSRHTPLLLVHVLFPLIGAGVFAGYFHISGWSEMTNVTTFLEVLAIIFPFVIGIVVGMIVELEMEQVIFS